MKKRGWTGLPRGKAIWMTPALRDAALKSRDRPLSARIAKFRIVRSEGECWGWSGRPTNAGYGVLMINRVQRMATHVALELDGRPQPTAKHFACHHCDNPICTNPSHLFWGTPSENTMDGYIKGRIKTPTERKQASSAPFIVREGL